MNERQAKINYWTSRLSAMAKNDKVNKYQLLGEKILSLLEQGIKPWQKSWTTKGIGFCNLLTGHSYSGVNPLLCNIDMLINNYKLPYFIGFAQGQEQGWMLRKGAKATWIRWSGVFELEKEDGEIELKRTFRWLAVYNVELWDDSKAKHKIQTYIDRLNETSLVNNANQRISAIEQYIERSGAKIKVGKQPCYYPDYDVIEMPPLANFISTESYYSTLLHELVHWTGPRCKRQQCGERKSSAYAYEELIAEIGSSILCENFQIQVDLVDHASYIQYWLKAMQNNKSYFWQAMAEAQTAVVFLDGLGKTAPTWQVELTE